MTDLRQPAGLGVAAAVGVVVLAAVPYGVSNAEAVWLYLGGGLVGPPLAALFAAVAAVALLGAARGRTDPAVAAGVAVVLGALVAGLLAAWAVGVSPALVGSLTEVAAFRFHRWLLAAVGVVQLAASAWFARAVL